MSKGDVYRLRIKGVEKRMKKATKTTVPYWIERRRRYQIWPMPRTG